MPWLAVAGPQRGSKEARLAFARRTGDGHARDMEPVTLACCPYPCAEGAIGSFSHASSSHKLLLLKHLVDQHSYNLADNGVGDGAHQASIVDRVQRPRVQ